MEWDDDFLGKRRRPGRQWPETQLMHSQIISAVERLPEAPACGNASGRGRRLEYQEAAEF